MTSSAPPLGTKDKERQHLALPDPALELDEDLGESSKARSGRHGGE
jgi:hypothetical protein